MIEKMYAPSGDVLDLWIEKLFPLENQGCINFGYWKGISRPLTVKKRVESQKRLYFELFKRFLSSSTRILEIGSGRGHAVAWLRQRGYSAYGIDLLTSQIEMSQAQYPELISYYKKGQAEQIPFEDRSFDSLFSLEAAQHFISFKQFCEESFRVLQRPGNLIVSTYFFPYEGASSQAQQIIPNNLEGFDRALVVSQAQGLMEEAGFIIERSPLSIGSEVFPLYAHWQKKQLGRTPRSALSQERAKWEGYYTGGGKKSHPWLQAFENGWVDYYVLEGFKR